MSSRRFFHMMKSIHPDFLPIHSHFFAEKIRKDYSTLLTTVVELKCWRFSNLEDLHRRQNLKKNGVCVSVTPIFKGLLL